MVKGIKKSSMKLILAIAYIFSLSALHYTGMMELILEYALNSLLGLNKQADTFSFYGKKLYVIGIFTLIIYLFAYKIQIIKSMSINIFFNMKKNQSTYIHLIILSSPWLGAFYIHNKALETGFNFMLLIGFLLHLIFQIIIIIIIKILTEFSNRTASSILFVCFVILYSMTGVLVAEFIKITGDTKFIKYLTMISDANYEFIFNFKYIFTIMIAISIISYSALQLGKISIKNNFNRTGFFYFIAFILLNVFFIPTKLFGNIYTIPDRQLSASIKSSKLQNMAYSVGMPFTSYLHQVALFDSPIHKDFELVKPIIESAQLFTDFSSVCGNHCPKYSRVVLLTIESLSTRYMISKEPDCLFNITPNLNHLMEEYQGSDILTNATPTLYGLTSIFTGQPNPHIGLESNYSESFVKRLKQEGFKTAFIRSSPMRFSNENVLFKQAGFNELYGTEHYLNDDNLAKYISEWGLEDRFVFEYALEYMKSNQGEQYFATILPADTHPPFGRKKYSSSYPTYDGDLSCADVNRHQLESYYRQDYDIGIFIDRIKTSGLLDDKTLVIITSDHSLPDWDGSGISPLDRIPIIFIAKEKLPINLTADNISQVDLAPTILDLTLGQAPSSYFGKSLLRDTKRLYLGRHGDKLVTSDGVITRSIILSNPNGQEEQLLIDLFNYDHNAYSTENAIPD